MRQMASELFVQISIRKAEARLLDRDNVSASGRVIAAKPFTDMFTKEKQPESASSLMVTRKFVLQNLPVRSSISNSKEGGFRL